MVLILYGVIAGLVFIGGRVTARNPEAILIKEGQVVQAFKIKRTPLLVIVNGQNVEMRTGIPPLADSRSTYPFRKNIWGEWTVDCAIDCRDEDPR